MTGENMWKFAVEAKLPPKNIQLVAQISSDETKPDIQWVYFYIAIFCGPLKAEMFESEELRKWCNDKLDGNDVDAAAAYTWSADGRIAQRPSFSKCVMWNHISIEQFRVSKHQSRRVAINVGHQLARTMRLSCARASSVVGLLFAVRARKWVHGASIQYAVAAGALEQLVRGCRFKIYAKAMKYDMSEFKYAHRQPHVSVFDLQALQHFGTATYYTYQSDEDGDLSRDANTVTLFFKTQEETIEYYKQRGWWKTMTARQFIHYTHGDEKANSLHPPQKLDVLDKHCARADRPQRQTKRPKSDSDLHKAFAKLSLSDSSSNGSPR